MTNAIVVALITFGLFVPESRADRPVIETLMRELQKRSVFSTGEFLPAWPDDATGQQAPLWPPDGFYGPLDDGVYFAVLVESARAALYDVAPNYLDLTPAQVPQLVAADAVVAPFVFKPTAEYDPMYSNQIEDIPVATELNAQIVFTALEQEVTRILHTPGIFGASSSDILNIVSESTDIGDNYNFTGNPNPCSNWGFGEPFAKADQHEQEAQDQTVSDLVAWEGYEGYEGVGDASTKVVGTADANFRLCTCSEEEAWWSASFYAQGTAFGGGKRDIRSFFNPFCTDVEMYLTTTLGNSNTQTPTIPAPYPSSGTVKYTTLSPGEWLDRPFDDAITLADIRAAVTTADASSQLPGIVPEVCLDYRYGTPGVSCPQDGPSDDFCNQGNGSVVSVWWAEVTFEVPPGTNLCIDDDSFFPFPQPNGEGRNDGDLPEPGDDDCGSEDESGGPVSLITGHKHERATDLTLRLPGGMLNFTRDYSSDPWLYRDDTTQYTGPSGYGLESLIPDGYGPTDPCTTTATGMLGGNWNSPVFDRLAYQLYMPTGDANLTPAFIGVTRSAGQVSVFTDADSDGVYEVESAPGQSTIEAATIQYAYQLVFASDLLDEPDASYCDIPVWRLTEPGGSIFYYQRDVGAPLSGCTNTRHRVLIGQLLRKLDQHGNRWEYDYLVGGLDGPEIGYDNESRLVQIRYFTALSGTDTIETQLPAGRVQFLWNTLDDSTVNNGRLSEVIAYHNVFGSDDIITEHEVAGVEYEYLEADTGDLGTAGDLVEVRAWSAVDSVREPPGGTPVENPRWYQITQYRYHDGNPSPSANGSDDRLEVTGVCHQLKAVIRPEQVEAFAEALARTQGSQALDPVAAAAELRGLLDGDSHTQLTSEYSPINLASKIVAYNGIDPGVSGDTSALRVPHQDFKVSHQYIQGDCGCGGGNARGTKVTYDYHVFNWPATSSPPSDKPWIPWDSGTSGEEPGFATQLTEAVLVSGVYTDYRRRTWAYRRIGDTPFTTTASYYLPRTEPAFLVAETLEDLSPSNLGSWTTVHVYDDDAPSGPGAGYKNRIATYSPSGSTLVTQVSRQPGALFSSPSDFTVSDSGFHREWVYNSEDRLVGERVVKPDSSGTALVTSIRYLDGTTSGRSDLPDRERRFRGGNRTDPDPGDLNPPVADEVEETLYAYGFYADGTIAWKRTRVEAELTSENGTGASTIDSYQLYDESGRPVWTIAEDDAVTYMQYDQVSGQLLQTVANANPNNAGGTGNSIDLLAYPGLSAAAGSASSNWGMRGGARIPGGEISTSFEYDDRGDLVNVTADSTPTGYSRRELWLDADGSGNGIYKLVEISLPDIHDTPSGIEFTGHAKASTYDAARRLIRSSTYRLPTTEPYDPPSTYTLLTTSGYELTREETVYDMSGLRTSHTRWTDVANNLSVSTSFAYDGLGRIVSTTDATGSVSEVNYDVVGRVIESRAGTVDETPELVQRTYYDAPDPATNPEQHGVGDGLATATVAYPDENDTSTRRIIVNSYDQRNRLIAVEQPAGVNAPDSAYVYDNLDRQTETASYNGAPLPTNRVAYRRMSYNQRGLTFRTETAFDPTSVEPSGDARQSAAFLEDNTWFDAAGRPIAQWSPGSPMLKTVYDGHGRPLTRSIVAGGVGDASWNPLASGTSFDPSTTTNDHVLEQIEQTYKDGSHQLLMTSTFKRLDQYPTDPGTGPLDASNSIATYVIHHYDDIGRRTGSTDYATNTPDTDPDVFATNGPAPDPLNPPTDRTYARTTSVEFDDEGRVRDRIAPDGRRTRTIYDANGRVIATVENAVNITESSLSWDAAAGRWRVTGYDTSRPDRDRVTSTVYDEFGRQKYRVAHTGDAADNDVQITRYDFGIGSNVQGSYDTGSQLASNQTLYAVVYPDETTGLPPERTDPAYNDYSVRYEYNLLGEQEAMTDQNGNRHEFEYDKAGRRISDTVTVLGEIAPGVPVDSSVRRVETSYDNTNGAVEFVTSFSDTAGTSVVNAVGYARNPLGMITDLYQNHAGPIDTSLQNDTRVLRYEYELADPRITPGANHARRTNVIYPAQVEADPASPDTTFSIEYGDPRTIGDRISRTSAYSGDWAAEENIVEYGYLGLARAVDVNYPIPDPSPADPFEYDDISLSYRHKPNGEQTAGTYHGLDRFGRVLRHRWSYEGFGPTSPVDPDHPNQPAIVDQAYAYDTGGNRTLNADARYGNRVPDRQWRLAYDEQERLVQAERGVSTDVLDPIGSVFTHTPGSEQWGLDMLGNWDAYREELDSDGDFAADLPATPGDPELREQIRVHNAANELEQSTSTEFDESVGASDNPVVFTYDRNGNLRTSLTNGVGETYTYDAWNRLVAVTHDDGTNTHDIGQYEYNGLGWRTVRRADTKGFGKDGIDEQRIYYFSNRWQFIEERVARDYDPLNPTTTDDTDRVGQQVWGRRYIDDAVAKRINRDGDLLFPTGVNLYYYLTDAQFSVLGLVDEDGAVAERVSYTPYGVARRRHISDYNGDGLVDLSDNSGFVSAFQTFQFPPSADYDASVDLVPDFGLADLDDLGAWSADAQPRMNGTIPLVPVEWVSNPSEGNGPDNSIGLHGMLAVHETASYLSRARSYSPVLGRWTTRDPSVYIDGTNWYRFAKDSPAMYADPTGLRSVRVLGTDALLHDPIGAYVSGNFPLGGIFGIESTVAGTANVIYDCKNEKMGLYVSIGWEVGASVSPPGDVVGYGLRKGYGTAWDIGPGNFEGSSGTVSLSAAMGLGGYVGYSRAFGNNTQTISAGGSVGFSVGAALGGGATRTYKTPFVYNMDPVTRYIFCSECETDFDPWVSDLLELERQFISSLQALDSMRHYILAPWGGIHGIQARIASQYSVYEDPTTWVNQYEGTFALGSIYEYMLMSYVYDELAAMGWMSELY